MEFFKDPNITWLESHGFKHKVEEQHDVYERPMLGDVKIEVHLFVCNVCDVRVICKNQLKGLGTGLSLRHAFSEAIVNLRENAQKLLEMAAEVTELRCDDEDPDT